MPMPAMAPGARPLDMEDVSLVGAGNAEEIPELEDAADVLLFAVDFDAGDVETDDHVVDDLARVCRV